MKRLSDCCDCLPWPASRSAGSSALNLPHASIFPGRCLGVLVALWIVVVFLLQSLSQL